MRACASEKEEVRGVKWRKFGLEVHEESTVGGKGGLSDGDLTVGDVFGFRGVGRSRVLREPESVGFVVRVVESVLV